MANIPIKIIKEIFERDSFTCQYCGKKGVLIRRYGKPCVIENPNGVNTNDTCGSYNGLDVVPFEIDHVIPLCYGGKTRLDNLVLSCKRCNRSKGSRLLGISYVE